MGDLCPTMAAPTLLPGGGGLATGIRAFDLSRSRLVDDNNAVKDFCTCKVRTDAPFAARWLAITVRLRAC